MNLKGAHLSYCLNIHQGETFEENLSSIKKYSSLVKKQVCPDKPLGLGLRLSNRAAGKLETCVESFRKFLLKSGMYVFTINGFPYGKFHGARIKEKVYQPDWATAERLSYTKKLGAILSRLLPDGVSGTISTLPVSYGKKLSSKAVNNLLEADEYLEKLEYSSGKRVILCLEPEPDCYLETGNDVIKFFEKLMKAKGRPVTHLGVCLDICHIACEFENPTETIDRLKLAGVQVPKIQLTSALMIKPACSAGKILKRYVDPVYLHQTRVLSGKKIIEFKDLIHAIEKNPKGEYRVHFHLPLHFKGDKCIKTTSGLLDKKLFSKILKPGNHLEIETYTFDILPKADKNVVESIVKEFNWIFRRLKEYNL